MKPEKVTVAEYYSLRDLYVDGSLKPRYEAPRGPHNEASGLSESNTLPRGLSGGAGASDRVDRSSACQRCAHGRQHHAAGLKQSLRPVVPGGICLMMMIIMRQIPRSDCGVLSRRTLPAFFWTELQEKLPAIGPY